MSSWQAALYRAFYENYKENPPSIETETKTEITIKSTDASVATIKKNSTSTVPSKATTKDKKKDGSFFLKKLLRKKRF